MSYLTNLLARMYQSPAGMVQPRLNSLLAPPEKSLEGSSSLSSSGEWETSQPAGTATQTTAQLPKLSRDAPAPRNTGPEAVNPVETRSAASFAHNGFIGTPGEVLASTHAETGKRSADNNENHERIETNPGKGHSAAPPQSTGIDVSRGMPRREVKPKDRKAEALAPATGRPENRIVIQESCDTNVPVPIPVDAARPATTHLPSTRIADPPKPGSTETPAARPEQQDGLVAIPIAASPLREAATPAAESAHTGFASSKAAEAMNAHEMDLTGFGWTRRLRVSPDARVPRTAQPDSPEPTIEVTIGRIEVRAGTPPQASRPMSRGTPGVSLDEYLRRRSGWSRE